eukprot:scaffold21162_cov65-Attheya_sp.AAC.2
MGINLGAGHATNVSITENFTRGDWGRWGWGDIFRVVTGSTVGSSSSTIGAECGRNQVLREFDGKLVHKRPHGRRKVGADGMGRDVGTDNSQCSPKFQRTGQGPRR